MENEKFEYTLNDTGYTIHKLEGTEYIDLVIPDEYDGKPVTEVADSAFSRCKKLRTLVVGENVKEIG